MISIKPFTGALGAEVLDLDLRQGIDPETLSALRNALANYGMLAVRNQTLEPDSLHRIARQFGPYSKNEIHVPVDGYEDIVAFVRTADATGPVIGERWHMDFAWHESPPGITILYGDIIPAVGGDTLFTSLCAAYDGLSQGMKELLHSLVGIHSGADVFKVNAAVLETKQDADAIENVEVRHPVVCTHPLTGRRYVMVSSVLKRFDNMTESESKPIIEFLQHHVTQPCYTCRLRWYQGTLGLWENPTLNHCAISDYAGQERRMLRTTVEGWRPIAANSSIFL